MELNKFRDVDCGGERRAAIRSSPFETAERNRRVAIMISQCDRGERIGVHDVRHDPRLAGGDGDVARWLRVEKG